MTLVKFMNLYKAYKKVHSLEMNMIFDKLTYNDLEKKHIQEENIDNVIPM